MGRSSSESGSRELQCVGRLEIEKPKSVGFLCGSIPVPTDRAYHAFNSAIVPNSQTLRAPRYRMLPAETDLNTPPTVFKSPEKLLPINSARSKTDGDPPWESVSITTNLAKKCEALAVSGLVEYGDEIDVIAPADIVKQIFKMPYSKTRLSIAVHRIGQTLVLNTGPDAEEGEKLVRRHTNQSKCADQSLFLKFAMHSVRMEACDRPPTHNPPGGEQSESSVLPGFFESRSNAFGRCGHQTQENRSQFVDKSDDVTQKQGFNHRCSHTKHGDFLWRSNKNKKSNGHESINKTSQVGEKLRCSMQESEKCRRVGNNGFLRVLFWQFHNFRMLLGSDLLLFSNEKYVAVSLHLWDVTQKVTPLTWLDAWLDNVITSVPELAICYHEKGVVRGYELLKTDDIFLLKGVSQDGTPAFYPHIVQQNGLSVLRFLQENCKQDPGAYWVYKSAGEDVIQLFDLSVIPKTSSSDSCDDHSSTLPSFIHRGRSDSLLSLGTLLYRIAHRLSLSMASSKKAKCASFFKKCIDCLDEPDHMVVRAFAHEQFARLILSSEEELDLASEYLPMESEVLVIDANEEALNIFSDVSTSSTDHRKFSLAFPENEASKHNNIFHDPALETCRKITTEDNVHASENSLTTRDTESKDQQKCFPSSHDERTPAMLEVSPTLAPLILSNTDHISSKLAAVSHVSRAIKSLRWMRQLQSTESDFLYHGSPTYDRPTLPTPMNSVCACGDADCIEICDIREWLPTSKLEHKLWKLILLLGESYLALGEAYKLDQQLHKSLKVVELACSVYGSMPQYLEDTTFMSSMINSSTSSTMHGLRHENSGTLFGDASKEPNACAGDECFNLERLSSTYLFWAKAWTLVGDVYVECHMTKGKEPSSHVEMKCSVKGLRMSSEVIKEVKRLKKKLGQSRQNCSNCLLVNCSCQGDRVSSGSSASSSTYELHALGYGKRNKKSYAKKSSCSLQGVLEDSHDCSTEHRKNSERRHHQHDKEVDPQIRTCNNVRDSSKMDASVSSNSVSSGDKLELGGKDSTRPAQSESASGRKSEVKIGGIFKYLRGPVPGDEDDNLEAALSCYEEARKALGEVHSDSAELHSVLKKKGWVCNELGRNRLGRKKIDEAELAFADAIKTFREVSDHTNIILINCNLGHGRRALAEEMVVKIENLKKMVLFQNAYCQALESAKREYCESLKFYGAAKSELNLTAEVAGTELDGLKNEVYTQCAHTYLRLGMLLASEDTVAEVYETGTSENSALGHHSSAGSRNRKEMKKHEISANEAIREALSMYKSLGELRKQEIAYTHFQLACYQRDCCLKFLDSNNKKKNSISENSTPQRVKQYASLAERNWQKAVEFYGPKTHPSMYVTVLLERASLLLRLSDVFHPNTMLESALSCLLEGHRVSGEPLSHLESSEVHAKFWSQLQMLLKKMLSVALSASGSKCLPNSHGHGQSPSGPNRYGEIGKLRELYKMSLKSTGSSQLQAMHSLWRH